MPAAYLEQEDVIAVASVLNLGDGAFIVGGQASNFWAERYAPRAPELSQYRPFTSIDIDYHGHQDVARKLAEKLKGRVEIPDIGDATPNSAVVTAEINGKQITIDFIHSVLGVQPRDLRVTELVVPARTADRDVALTIPVMHPIACLMSRVANILSPATARRDGVAMRQVQAAPIVVREFISEALKDGDIDEAHSCLQRLYVYLRSNQYGRRAHVDVPIDVLDVIRYFADDNRLDARYRENNIQSILRRIEARRAK